MTTPPIPPVQQPAPAPGQNTPDVLKEALRYARDTAQVELDRIDKIHERTVKYISYYLLVVTGGLGLLGWIGFSNLKTLAVETAKTSESQEVARQVADKLKQADIKRIVNEQMEDFVSHELGADLEKAIKSGPLHKEILDAASIQSRQLVVESIGQRHLSPDSSRRLTDAINAETRLQNYPISVSGADFNPEAYRYSKEISKAISISKAKSVDPSYGSPAVEVPDGVVIYYDEKLDPVPAQRLLRCFEAAGIKSRVEGAPFNYYPINGSQSTSGRIPSINVEVGPKPLPK
jgi:hypothetical protein